MELPVNPSRKEVLNFLSQADIYGNLGLFLGAGFCKAILNDKSDEIALSWGQLVEKAATALKIDFNAIPKEGRSYPEISTEICQRYKEIYNVGYNEARTEFKRKIAHLTGWYPSSAKRESFGSDLSDINPSWIITTNYDLVIESLLTGKSLSLGPKDLLISPKGIIPVFHLHGIRTSPESIIITQEDYVTLFRPAEYRQLKLALTIKESTTLFIGYGLGDVNVLTAVDWSKNVFPQNAKSYPHEMIQVLWEKHPKNDPYRDKNNVLIVETKEIKDFLDEFKKILSIRKNEHEKEMEALNSFASFLYAALDEDVDKFIDDQEYRISLINDLVKYETYLISDFLTFLSRCFEETWHRAEPSGAFEAYEHNLHLTLDILIRINIKKMPPALFESLADNLDRVASYIGYDLGQSWPANDTWLNMKDMLPKETVEELKLYAEQQGGTYLRILLNDLN